MEADNETTDDNNNPVGPLSYAISKVFAGLDSGMTYRSFFAKVQAVMNEKLPNQHPVMTGDGQDRRLFAGKFVTQKPYVLIDKITGNHLTLRSGEFEGLDSGARVALYPSGTTDPHNAKLLTAGTVIKAGLYNAEVQLDANPGIKDASLGWIFITTQVFKNSVLRVAIANNVAGISRGKLTTAYSLNETQRLHNALKGLPGVRLSNNPDINIARGIGTPVDSLIISATGKLFDTITNASRDTSGLKAKIKAYARYNFLKSVILKDADNEIEVKLLPVIDNKPDTTFLYKDETSFSQGDKLMIWVHNKSRNNLYINILDLQPDGVINPILPNSSQRIFADDLLVPSGSSFLFKNYTITIEPPFGREIFKVFASTDKIDLEDIANSRGAVKRGNLRPLEALVQRSFNLRGQAAPGVSDHNGNSYNLYFDIVPKP